MTVEVGDVQVFVAVHLQSLWMDGRLQTDVEWGWVVLLAVVGVAGLALKPPDSGRIRVADEQVGMYWANGESHRNLQHVRADQYSGALILGIYSDQLGTGAINDEDVANPINRNVLGLRKWRRSSDWRRRRVIVHAHDAVCWADRR